MNYIFYHENYRSRQEGGFLNTEWASRDLFLKTENGFGNKAIGREGVFGLKEIKLKSFPPLSIEQVVLKSSIRSAAVHSS